MNNTYEYPIIEGVEPHELVKAMGLGFKQDLKTKVASYGKKQADALEVNASCKMEIKRYPSIYFHRKRDEKRFI